MIYSESIIGLPHRAKPQLSRLSQTPTTESDWHIRNVAASILKRSYVVINSDCLSSSLNSANASGAFVTEDIGLKWNRAPARTKGVLLISIQF